MPAQELASRAPVTEQNPLFADLGVSESIITALSAAGITRAFAIQEMTLPIALAGDDLIGQARTGTGKTLGFGIPVLERVTVNTDGDGKLPQALVVVPTRELCVQVAKDLSTAGAVKKVRVQAVYGGRAYEPQVTALTRGVDVVVGTPGRLLDLANQGYLKLRGINTLVLDEADEMLDLGFLPDIERVMALLPVPRQTMLFSATMPGPIISLARKFMHQPVHIRAENSGDGHTVPATDQHAYRVHPMDKVEVLARILQAQDRGLTMVFCRTKRTAQKVGDDLVKRGFAAAAIHGDLGQGAREQGMRAFRSGSVDVLVATDVAARGIDVSGVTHVVNYQCPEDEKTYVHRIGRTGRAGASGVAVTFVDWDELHRWDLIAKALDLPLREPKETYSTSEHLFTDLNISTSVTGTIPTAMRKRVKAEPDPSAGDTEGGKRPRGRRRSQRKAHSGHDSTVRSTSEDNGSTSTADTKTAARRSRQRRRTRGGTDLGNGSE